MIKHSMEKLFLLCMCSLGLYGTLFPQSPTGTPIASPTAAATAAADDPDDGRERSAGSRGTACARGATCAPALGCAAWGRLNHGGPRFDDMAGSRQRLGRRRVVLRSDSVPDWSWLFDCMEIGEQK